MAADDTWAVRTLQLSVGQGDSAVHLLIHRSDQEGERVKSAVLVDGGVNKFALPIRQLLGTFDMPRIDQRSPGSLDAMVVTHWDEDHYGGVLTYLLDGFLNGLDGWLNLRGSQPYDQDLKTAMRTGELTCPYIKYDTQNKWYPLTRWYGPNASFLGFKRDKTVKERFEIDVDYGYELIKVKSIMYVVLVLKLSFVWRGIPLTLNANVFVAIMCESHSTLIGVDAFTGDKHMENIVPSNPLVVSNVLAAKGLHPVMFCVASNGKYYCDPIGDKKRKKMKWIQRFRYQDIKLVGKAAHIADSDWKEVPFCESDFKKKSPSTKVVMTETSDKNKSSVAFMVIWPHPEKAQISHYFGGDLDYAGEEKILRWSTVPENQDEDNRNVVRLNYVKLSHHGSKNSTPLMMLFAWNPKIVVSSNGTHLGHNLISWETLFYICVWTRWRYLVLNDTILPRFYATSVPGYLCRIWLFGGTSYMNTYPITAGDSVKALSGKEGGPWRLMLKAMKEADVPIKEFEEIKGVDAYNIALTIVDLLFNFWEEITPISFSHYDINFLESGSRIGTLLPQSLQLIQLDMRRTFSTIGFFYGASIPEAKPSNFYVDRGVELGTLDTSDAHLETHPARTLRPVNNKTRVLLPNSSSRKRPPRRMSSKEAVEVLMMGTDYSLRLVDRVPSAEHLDRRSIARLARTDLRECLSYDRLASQAKEDEMFFLMSNDAKLVEPNHPSKPAVGNLDWFLGNLSTGAIVFPRDPFPKSEAIDIHETDELLQWLSLVLEGKDEPNCKITVAVASDTLSLLQLSSKLKLCFKAMGISDLVTTTFSTEHNPHAFNLSPPFAWPAVNPAQPDIVGPPQILCLSIGPAADIYNIKFTGENILKLADFNSGPASRVLTNSIHFTVDKKPGARNTLWFHADPIYTTTLRLAFVPSQETSDALEKLRSSLNKFLDSIGVKLSIKLDNPTVVVKRVTNKKESPYQVRSTLYLQGLVTVTHPNAALPFDMGIAFDKTSTTWTLNFDVHNKDIPADDRGDTKVKPLLEFVKDLFDLPKDVDLNILAYLPGFDRILIRSVEYVWNEDRTWSLTVNFQIVLASMPFLCSVKVRKNKAEDKGFAISFVGNLFAENRPGKDGLGEVFNYSRYLPDQTSWDNLQFLPTPEAKGGSDVGALDKLFNRIGANANATLPDSPFDPRLTRLHFSLIDETLRFGATVMTPSPDTKQYAVPVLRLSAADMDLAYDFKNKRLQSFELQTGVVLTAPKTSESAKMWGMLTYQGGAANSLHERQLTYRQEVIEPGHAILDHESTRIASDTTWVFAGSVFQLRGSLIYSLFDDDCNSEIAQLLQHVTLDFNIVYRYVNKSGRSFEVDGTLYLGDLQLHCFYKHKGKTESRKSDWTFGAELAITGQKTNLLSVIESVCGKDLSQYIPDCIADVDASPDTTDMKLTSLVIKREGDYVLVYIRVQLTSTSSIALYQLQRNKKGDVIPPTKRVIMFQLASLPSVDNIPVVGSLSLPFTQIQFLLVTNSSKDSTEGLNSDEIDQMNKNLPTGFSSIHFKELKKKKPKAGLNTAEDPVETVLQNGFHFMILDDDKALIDYIFWRPKPKGKAETTDEATGGQDKELAPFNKKLGPVTISAVGLKFDIKTQTLTFLVNGSVKLGPLELDLMGFGLSFRFPKGTTLRKLDGIEIDFSLAGLGLSFEKNPVVLSGFLERSVSPKLEEFKGGATIGFQPWVFQAGAYYAKSKRESPSLYFKDKESFTCFMAYASLSGPIATIGYAEIQEICGGMGYNTSLKFPNMENIMRFPFIADKPEDPSAAIKALFSADWMSIKEGTNWVAAGLTVYAFQLLTVRAVIVVEWDRNVKLGIFGLATAEMPKQLDKKFAKVQLGIAATIDFDAGVMKIDGQLTPASFVLDSSVALTGGFAMYSWFGEKNGPIQGDWVFSIGGYHSNFQVPSHYPVPPRLGISWSYDKNINISGKAYFAITPKVCMGGGQLHVSFELGPLSAYFDAYADFLINYKPFYFQADGGVSVGVKFVQDLWLVTLSISIDIGAQLHLEGPPMGGRVRVNFYIKAFNIYFGKQPASSRPISGDAFWELVLQADTSQKPAMLDWNTNSSDIRDESTTEDPTLPAAVIFACTSGLISKGESKSRPSGGVWLVRGAILAFTVSFKFPVKTATVVTQGVNDKDKYPQEVGNKAPGKIFAKPMQLREEFEMSDAQIVIRRIVPPQLLGFDEEDVTTPQWTEAIASYSDLPTALWERYDEATDPNAGDPKNKSSLLNGNVPGVVRLMTGVSLKAPATLQSCDLLPPFNAKEAFKEIVADGHFVQPRKAQESWNPAAPSDSPYEDIRNVWTQNEDKAKEVTAFWEKLRCFNWIPPKLDNGQPERPRLSAKKPERLIKGLKTYLVEAPALTVS